MNTTPRNNNHALTLRLPSELYAQLRERAEAEDRTVAWVLRRLARQYLEDTTPAPAKNRSKARNDGA